MSNDDSKTGRIVLISAGAALSVLLIGALREPIAKSFPGWGGHSEAALEYNADQVITRVLPAALSHFEVYVPVETKLQVSQDKATTLSPTLSIRNTSDADALYVESVALYGTDGAPLRNYLKHTLEVAPFASLKFELIPSKQKGEASSSAPFNSKCVASDALPTSTEVEPSDSCSVAPSHFVVRYGITKGQRSPLIETLMVDEDGGVSHIRSAYPMSDVPQEKVTKVDRCSGGDKLVPLAVNLPPLPKTPRPSRPEPEYELIRYDSDYGLRAKGL